MSMPKSAALVSSLLLVDLVAVTPAWAADIHFVAGPTLILEADGDELIVGISGTLDGLKKHEFVELTFFLLATHTVMCANFGGNEPTSKEVPSDFSIGFQLLLESETIDALFEIPDVATGVCPNSNWTATIEDIDVTLAELTITQGDESLECFLDEDGEFLC
ncbi:hypothetical protein OV090_27100 [Nannocystis sp. RBIL2]|uniref:hypothetical protein n=1 Tax=Nannocystis sp. RBIL2 TaxID=2996788 RepID=UPI00226DD962|nr:hypothetical protein [Nannocystis sp. RBIL2]MCY1068440.1 hypothetical protein [Nannocystis sp. RBIL2]